MPGACTMKRAERSPRGRRKLVLTPAGEAALEWDEDLTTLEGQLLQPLADAEHASVDDLFEAAGLAEATGDADEAARLYDLCARADRKDRSRPSTLATSVWARAHMKRQSH